MTNQQIGLKRALKSSTIAAGLVIAFAASAPMVHAATFVNGATQGFYNDSIGTVLNGTNPVIDDNAVNTFLFPNDNSNPNDPSISSTPEPDLSAAAGALGNWLGDPGNLNGNWSGPQAIPATWAVNSETAIIYEIDAGATGLTGVKADFGVDNGIFVWLDGVFLGGQMAPGGQVPGELMLSIGNLAAGQHHLQVLREDHGGGTGYSVLVEGEVTAIPLPAALPLITGGLGLLGLVGWRRRRKVAA